MEILFFILAALLAAPVALGAWVAMLALGAAGFAVGFWPVFFVLLAVAFVANLR